MSRPAPGTSGTDAPKVRSRWTSGLVAAEAILVFALLLVWLSSESVRASKHLAVLFFYSFPSEFLVGLIPHEPALIYFGTFHPAWVVAVVAGVGTVLAEGMNYRLFSHFYDTSALRAASDHKAVRKMVEMFHRKPFAAILFAGFTPVPFFPVRFIVVMARYPVSRYLWGVFLSRTPRFYLLAALGGFVAIPTTALGLLFLAMLLAVNLPTLYRVLAGSRSRAEGSPDGAQGWEAAPDPSGGKSSSM